MDARDEAIDLATLRLAFTGAELSDIKRALYVALAGYDIRPKEKQLILYENKNEEAIKRYIIAKGIAGLAERTLRMYASTLTRAFGIIRKDYDKVESEDVQLLLATVMTKGSKRYANDIRVVLNGFYAWLLREEIVTRSPMNKIDIIKYRSSKEDAFSDIEVERMREACRTRYEKAVIEFLLSTGCRAFEAASVTIEQAKEDEITIVGKGDKERKIYVNAKARIAINGFLAERIDRNPYLFPASVMKNGRHIQSMQGGPNWYLRRELVGDDHVGRETINNIVKRVAKRANVDGCHAHRFRRTCATNALKHGMPIELVSMMLGHSNIATTQIYLSIGQDALRNAHGKYVL